MAKSDNKTVETSADVAGYVGALADAGQREDAMWIAETMARLSGFPARMWGPSIIGFGRYHYRYESGREGEMCRIGFSPRKGQIVLYLIDGFPRHAELLARLGKHKTGKSCLYIKKLADVDRTVIEELIKSSLNWMREKYPEGA